MKKRMYVSVYVGNVLSIEIPPAVEKSYEEAYFRPRAPKKSLREARQMMNRDFAAIENYCLVTGLDGFRLPKSVK